MKTKIYPDRTFENAMRAKGYLPKLLWEEKGPKDTDVAWMSAYFLGTIVVIHQTYTSGGWEVYSPCNSVSREDAINDVIARM